MEKAVTDRDELEVLLVGPRVSLGPDTWNLLALSHGRGHQAPPRWPQRGKHRIPIEKQNATIEGRNVRYS